MNHLMVAVLTFTLSCASASAEQCKIVSQQQAAAAAAFLKPGAEIATYCKSCEDKEPLKGKIEQSETRLVPQIEVEGLDSTVYLNGKPAVLANVFLLTGPETYTNVAKMVGCPVVSTPGFLTLR